MESWYSNFMCSGAPLNQGLDSVIISAVAKYLFIVKLKFISEVVNQ